MGVFKVANHSIYSHPLPEGHRFPMQKYELLPQQLLWEGVVEENAFFSPEILDVQLLKNVHHPMYVDRAIQGSLSALEIRRIGFPMSEQLIERELRITKGTIDGAVYALQDGIAFNIAGGTHHAGSDWGEGFCIFNDQAVAAQYLLKNKQLKRIAIIDLDVHQGNGTADIFKQQDSVYTFSVHCGENFPFRKENSTWDLPLEKEIKDEAYLQVIERALKQIFESYEPEFIFYQAGVDVLETDVLGKFALTLNGCKHRDEIVLKMCKKYGVPVQVSMGGGYSKDIKIIVEAHSNTFKLAKDIFCV